MIFSFFFFFSVVLVSQHSLSDAAHSERSTVDARRSRERNQQTGRPINDRDHFQALSVFWFLLWQSRRYGLFNTILADVASIVVSSSLGDDDDDEKPPKYKMATTFPSQQPTKHRLNWPPEPILKSGRPSVQDWPPPPPR